MKRKPKPIKVVKTSISIPQVLMEFAEKQLEKEGFSSFSAYLAALIRADKDRREGSSGETASTFPPSKSERVELNERREKP